MNKKPLIGLVLVLLLGAVAFWVYLEDQNTSTLPLNDFAVEDTASVDRILIQTYIGNYIDLKREDEHWSLNDSLIAKEYAVNRALQVLHDAKVRNEVSDSMNNTLKQLLVSGYKKVSVYQNGEWTKSWWIGTNSKDSYATHMLLETKEDGKSSKFFEVHIPSFRGVLGASFFISAADWKSQKMWGYHPSAIRNIKMTYFDNPSESFEIEYDGKDVFITKDGQGNVFTPDTSILKNYLLEYKKAFHNGVEMELKPEDIAIERAKAPFAKLEIIDAKGLVKTLVMVRKDRPGGSLKVNEEVQYTYDPNQFFGMLNGGPLLRLQYYHMDRFFVQKSFLEK